MNIEELKKIMEEKQITSYRLAKLSGVSNSLISRILSGRTTNPGIDTVVAIAKALEVDIARIVNMGE